MLYDLIKNNTIIKTKDFNSNPSKLPENKGKWLKQVIIDCEYDFNTQAKELTYEFTDTESKYIYKAVDLSQEQQVLNLQKYKDNKCSIVNDDTKSKILAIASEAKQRNYLATAISIENKQRNGISTIEEDTILNNIKTIWSTIEELIHEGNYKEAEIQNAVSFEDVNNIII